MAKKIDLRSPKVREQKRQVATYGTQTPLSSTAVERGSTRWLDGSNVSIEGLLSVSGTATVGGTLSVTGTLNASGAINLSGSTGITGPLNVTGTTTIGGNTNITGELNVTGPTTLDGVLDIGGDTTITGLLEITGNTTVDGDFEITGNGLFRAGETTIEPTGKAQFGEVIIDPQSIYLMQTPGGWISGTGTDDISLSSTASSSVTLNSQGATLDYLGISNLRASAGRIDLTTTKVWISDQMEVAGTEIHRGQNYFYSSVRFLHATLIFGALPTTTQPANLFADPTTGRVYRSTA